MIILQIDTTTHIESSISTANDNLFYLEIVILIIIAVFQLYRSVRIYFNITELKNIFNNRLFIKNGFVEKVKLGNIENDSDEIQYDKLGEESFTAIAGEDIIKLSLVETNGKSAIIIRIKNVINTYLINNYGAAVNFSIIKDIIDREVDIKDEEISASITVPLYLGLAATMFGIILGLWSMPELDGKSFSEGVNALIRGVQWAMGASLFGLLCTTILSSFFYKNAKRKTLNDKNEQLSYLQAKLLPELIKAEDTGVSGLKASLDRFARVATNISDNVLIAANQTGENLVLQQEIIDKVEKIGVLRLSKTNLELFDKLDKNMEAFLKFSTYLDRMERISSNLLEFASRTSNIDRIIQEIDSNLKDSKQLSQFLSAHFDKIETAGNAALKSVGLAESHFEDAIENLKIRTDEMINQLYKSAGNHEIKLQEIYTEIEKSLKSITSEYIHAFSTAYSNSIPRFEQLDNLSLLPHIKDEFLLKTKEFQEHSKENTLQSLTHLKDLNESLKVLQNNLQNHAILNKLESIDEKLKRKTNGSVKRKNLPTNPDSSSSNLEIEIDNNQPIGLGKVMKKLFKN
jgi:hypothetical protein